MTLTDAIDQYSAYLPTRNYSLLSVKAARSKLGDLARFCERNGILWPDEGALIRWQIERARKVAKVTTYHDATMIRTFFAWCARMKITEGNIAIGIEVPKRPKKLPRPLDDNVLHELLYGRWKSTYMKRDRYLVARDRALVQVYATTGLRRAELCSLDVGDVQCAANGDVVLNVRGGKGDRDRNVPVPGDMCDLSPLTRGRNLDDPLFIGKGGRRLDPNAVSYVFIRKVSPAVGARVTPHTLRHSYATYLCRQGVSVRQIQELLGHSSLATTQLYMSVSIGDLSRAVSVISGLGR